MADVNIDANVLKDAVDLGQKIGLPRIEGVEIPYAIVPSNSTMVSLLAQRYPYGLPPRKPDHIKMAVTLSDADSFCKYVALYQDDRSRVFANPQAHSFLAVLDYHGATNTPTPFIPIEDGSGTAPTPSVPSPEFMDHRATLALRKSEQWDLWIAKDGKEIPQVEFAEFLEDNYRDIFEPSPASMLEVARDLAAKSEVSFSSKVTAKSGAVQLTYNEVVNATVGPTGDIEVPNFFTILIPVFFGENPVKIEARLRFRINQGKLKFVYKLYRPSELLAAAFEAAALGIGQELHTEVLLGSI